jgi:uncharacterized protein YjeT (DUF2065 family)
VNPVGLILIAAGALFLWLARLSRAGRLPRNGLVGIRIPSTLASDEAWQAGHLAAAPLTRAIGGVWLGAGVVLLFVAAESPAASILTGGSTAAVLVLVLLAALVADRATRRSS